jgi:hypothetical protein
MRGCANVQIIGFEDVLIWKFEDLRMAVSAELNHFQIERYSNQTHLHICTSPISA